MKGKRSANQIEALALSPVPGARNCGIQVRDQKCNQMQSMRPLLTPDLTTMNRIPRRRACRKQDNRTHWSGPFMVSSIYDIIHFLN